MAKEYDNELRGALFKNERRERETQPQYTGTVTVEGQEYWLSAWVKEGRNGKYFSLSLTPKETKPAQGRTQTQAAGRGKPEPDMSDMQDDIPF